MAGLSRKLAHRTQLVRTIFRQPIITDGVHGLAQSMVSTASLVILLRVASTSFLAEESEGDLSESFGEFDGSLIHEGRGFVRPRMLSGWATSASSPGYGLPLASRSQGCGTDVHSTWRLRPPATEANGGPSMGGRTERVGNAEGRPGSDRRRQGIAQGLLASSSSIEGSAADHAGRGVLSAPLCFAVYRPPTAIARLEPPGPRRALSSLQRPRTAAKIGLAGGCP